MADDTIDSADADQLSGSMRSLEERTRSLSTGANSFARAITAAFTQGAAGARSFDSVLKSLVLRLSSLSLNLALRPVTGALTGGLDRLFSGLSGGGTTSSDTDLLRAMNTAQPFATGGVIASPSYFPLGGGLGVAGEAGPEAIMPLTRGPDGKLGVAASGAAAGNVTVNIATPDAESFRRSETYLTGLIARAVDVSRRDRGSGNTILATRGQRRQRPHAGTGDDPVQQHGQPRCAEIRCAAHIAHVIAISVEVTDAVCLRRAGARRRDDFCLLARTDTGNRRSLRGRANVARCERCSAQAA